MLASDWHWLINTPAGFVMVLVAGSLVLSVIYATPTILAWSQGCRRLWLVACINLFLGWTILVWIGLLFWALICGGGSEIESL